MAFGGLAAIKLRQKNLSFVCALERDGLKG
jgi:hypothetical protein